MLRLVIQISMLLAIPLMGVFLFWQIERCAWFCGLRDRLQHVGRPRFFGRQHDQRT